GITALALTNTELPGHDAGLVRVFQILAGLPGAAALFRWLLRRPAYRRSAFGFGGAFEDASRIEGEFTRVTIDPLIGGGIHDAMRSLRRADLRITQRLDEIHARIDAPLLCIWGDRDPFFPVAGAQAMVERWPQPARLETIAGNKLLVHEESAERVAALMAPFFATHAEGGRDHAISA
ncbi:MAG: alpha/beta hydrolase, partial [Deltaproteobacteria bacterium]|nr:alpha/beta hydrolase [Deltaproteobacteria bacterium]